MVHPYRQTVVAWFQEIWHKGNLGALDRFMTDDTVFHSADGLVLKGYQAFRNSHLQFLGLFKKLQCVVKHSLIDGHELCATVHVKAIHRKTGKRVHFQVMNRVRFDEEGKICEAWDTVDWLTCLTQLGALPEGFLLKGLTGET